MVGSALPGLRAQIEPLVLAALRGLRAQVEPLVLAVLRGQRAVEGRRVLEEQGALAEPPVFGVLLVLLVAVWEAEQFQF